jgi:hypothetical protein
MTRIHYPELRHARITSTTMHQAVPREPRHTTWASSSQESDYFAMSSQQIPGVRIEMPLEDFERMITIYQTHYAAADANPAVLEAWQAYRMLVALTVRNL